MELSGPQVILYLMNWGDHLTSHQYVSVYWFQLATALKVAYPDLQGRQNSLSDDAIEGMILPRKGHEVSRQ